MEPAKSFNNVILGQFVLTGVPVKVYTNGRFLTITDVEDVEDPIMGFGMDENGAMRHFQYSAIEKLSVQGNEVTLDTYNQGMEDKFSGGDEDKEDEEEEEKDDKEKDDEEKDDDPFKEESTIKLGNILKEISQDEVDAEVEGAEAAMDAAKAKLKAAQASMKNTIKTSKEKIKAAKNQPIDEMHGANYTFGVGDIVKNKNTSCPHHGSMGIVDKVMDLPNAIGKVAVYTVTNDGMNYSPGDKLTKTIDQLEPVDEKFSMNIQVPDVDKDDID
jgi:hypothetical protein